MHLSEMQNLSYVFTIIEMHKKTLYPVFLNSESILRNLNNFKFKQSIIQHEIRNTTIVMKSRLCVAIWSFSRQ